MYLSVSLISYNGSSYIREQLDSILEQTKKVDEIVIVDDGSTDETNSIIAFYQAKFPSIIQWHKNEKQLGSTKNMEKAIRLCKGDIIFLADQDDIWHANKVANTLQYFEQHPKIDAVFSNALLINNQSNIIPSLLLWDIIGFDISTLPLNEPNSLLKFLCCVDNIVTGAGLAIRNDPSFLAIPFPNHPKLLHDAWIGLWYASYNKLGYNQECLFRYRIHDAQQMGGKIEDPKGIQQLNKAMFDERMDLSSFKKVRIQLNRLEHNVSMQKILSKIIKTSAHDRMIELVCKQLNDYTKKGEEQYPIQSLLRKLKKGLGF